MNKIQEALKAPFPIQDIKWRAGATNQDKTKALALAYIDARTIMDRLDDVVGAEFWQDEYTHFQTDAGTVVVCRLGVSYGAPRYKLENENLTALNGLIWKSDGAGQAKFEGEKAGLSDAFKRAAVKHGIGRYLYSLGATWVACEQKGKSVVLKGVPALPEWALPAKQKTSGTRPASPSGIRPYKPEQLKTRLQEMAAIAKNKDAKVPDVLRNILAKQLNTLCSGNEEDRHELCNHWWGDSSTKKMAADQVLATLRWIGMGDGKESFDFTPDQVVVQEAAGALAAL